MRKGVAMTLALPLPLALIAAVLIVQARQAPPWKSELEAYLAYQRVVLSQTMQVQLAEQASHRWAFTPEMSRASFGDSSYYQTSYTYQAQEGEASGVRPLPFPPEEVWCALLEREPSGGPVVVFVVEHQDIYNASTVVHEPADDPSASAFLEGLSRVGCESVRRRLQNAPVR